MVKAAGENSLSTVDGIAQVQILDSGGVVRQYLAASTDTVSCFLQTKDLHAGDPIIRKIVDLVELDITDQSFHVDLHVSIYGRDDLTTPRKLLADLTPNGNNPFRMHTTGYGYVSLRIEDRSIRRRWKLTGFRILGNMAGKRY